MKKTVLVFLMTSLLMVLSACGGMKNSTPMEAAETFMKSMVEGDSELNAEINHSSPFSFPTHHVIDMANNNGLVGKDLSDIDFKEHEEDPKKIIVTWQDEEGEPHDWTLDFNEEKDGYYFSEID